MLDEEMTGTVVRNILKTRAKSKLISCLTPDQKIPSLTQATEFIKAHSDPNDPDRQQLFHMSRLVSRGAHFAFTWPEIRPHYRPLLVSSESLSDLDLTNLGDNMEELFKILDGETVYHTESIFPYSLAYAGFQFGEFAGQLGDGRVVNLFDLPNKLNEMVTLQLKGSGRTPFSRFADGKAVLRSCIREFVISEALYGIGIPSTRALQLTLLPGTLALREGGNMEPCAVVCRYSPSWLRLGNFDMFRWRPDIKGLISLSDYCIDSVLQQCSSIPTELVDFNLFTKNWFPGDKLDEGKILEPLDDGQTRYDKFFRQVLILNAECVAYWQAYGFLNGVLNTDNTSILGLSMDFGPFSFMDKFQPEYTPNRDDVDKRYCFARQPSVIWWNLTQFAQAISVLLGAGSNHIGDILSWVDFTQMSEPLEKELVERCNRVIGLARNEYTFRFTCRYVELMANRLGIKLDLDASKGDSVAKIAATAQNFLDEVVHPLLLILQKTGVDYNNFFLNLQRFCEEHGNDNPLQSGTTSSDININESPCSLYLSIFFKDYQLNKLRSYYSEENNLVSDHGAARLLVELLQDIKEWTSTFTNKYLQNKNVDKLPVADRKNPLFFPRSWIFDEVIEDVVERQSEALQDPHSDLDVSLLEKLHLMSANPYDRSMWDDTLRMDVVDRWSNSAHASEADDTKFMQQTSCSS